MVSKYKGRLPLGEELDAAGIILKNYMLSLEQYGRNIPAAVIQEPINDYILQMGQERGPRLCMQLQ